MCFTSIGSGAARSVGGAPYLLTAGVRTGGDYGLRVTSAGTPESLLKKLQALEMEFGRRPKKLLNEPRPLDLDLIAFGDERRTAPALTLPHPRAHQRSFVLQPLAEISPDFILPGQTNTVLQLLNKVSQDQKIQKLSS